MLTATSILTVLGGASYRNYFAEGAFRLSGEKPIKWMYDQLSLTHLLKKSGYDKITVMDAAKSMAPNYANFQSDIVDQHVRQTRLPLYGVCETLKNLVITLSIFFLFCMAACTDSGSGNSLIQSRLNFTSLLMVTMVTLTIDHPIKTLEAARGLVRQVNSNMSGDVIVSFSLGCLSARSTFFIK